MDTQNSRPWSYSEIIGAMLRQERHDHDPSRPESTVEQLVRQLEDGLRAGELEIDLSSLVHCPECEPDIPCPGCSRDRIEMAREIRDHLRRVESSGGDVLAYLNEADRFHRTWQSRFEQLHLAAMGGETLS